MTREVIAAPIAMAERGVSPMEDEMHGFWKNWMTVWCWAVLAFGVVLALTPVPVANAAPRLVYALLSGDPAAVADLDLRPMQFGLGLQGALTIGWALTIMSLVRVADIAGAPVWRSLTFALLVWYAIDSTISVATGFPLNAVSNTVLLAGYLAPVLGAGVLRGGERTAPA
jgi:hypothetical protein